MSGRVTWRLYRYDDYTAVTAYINGKFAQIIAEKGQTITGTKFKNGTENGTEALPEKAFAFLMNYTNKKRMTAEGIMKAIVSDSTIPRIAEVSGSSVRTVKRYLKEFEDGDILKREGSDANGEWILS